MIMSDVKPVLAICIMAVFLVGVTPMIFSHGIRKRANNRIQDSLNDRRLFLPFPKDSFNINSLPALDFVKIVSKYGYPAEEHVVTTADGYRLRIHRIPGSPSRPKGKGKPIIFLQHGLFLSSDSWVLMGPRRDLAYMMADAGYDVWVGNIRGNTYSRSHVRLRPDYDKEFWRYSWHEMAIYDMPAVIDYILDQTGEKSLAYLGHSMGTTISYVLLSMKPEYNDKVWLVVSLAPVAYWYDQPRTIVRFIKTNTESLKVLFDAANMYEFFPRTLQTIRLLKSFCGKASPFQPLCLYLWWFMVGENPDQLDMETVIPGIFAYIPAGTSRYVVEHYSQNIVHGDFRMFDYGREGNLAKYGQPEPPSYRVENIRAPVAMYYSDNDALVAPKDPFELEKRLKNVAAFHRIADDHFNHLDFIISIDIKPLLNDPVMALVMEYEKRRKGRRF